MAKNKKNYKLSSDAVNSLANASEDTAPQYSQEELKKYRSKEGLHIPEWLKIVLLKAWFPGAVCFFFVWGMGNVLASMLDRLFVTAVVMGMATNLLLNPIIRFMEPEQGANNKWMMVPSKGMGGFLLDLGYGFVITFCVFMMYNIINIICISVTGDPETIYLGVEPILFGLFSMAFDLLFLGMKRLLLSILRDAKAGRSRSAR